jgi:hypothetical protein
VLPERKLYITLPAHAIPKGYDWDQVGEDLLNWLLANHTRLAKEGESSHVVPVASNPKSGPLHLTTRLQTVSLRCMAGACLIRREMPGNLETVVDKALKTKVPKLVGAAANKRILLLALDQTACSEGEVYRAVLKLAPSHPDLNQDRRNLVRRYLGSCFAMFHTNRRPGSRGDVDLRGCNPANTPR